MTDDPKYAASRAGMKRLRDSRRRQSIKCGNRCQTCEAFIGPGTGRPRDCPACESRKS